MKNQLIKESKNYKLEVGISDETKDLVYKIINKKYGVIEVETHIYPQALKNIEDLEAGIQALEDMRSAKSPIIKSVN